MVRSAGDRLRRLFYGRQIEAALRTYRERGGADADAVESFSDSGSFRTQLDRLFRLGFLADTGELQRIAESVVSSCLTNRYYRPADYLADVADALDSLTLLSGEPDGEAALELLDEPGRRLKLKRVTEAWLVPAKVAAIEGLLEAHVRAVGRRVSYPALGRFERQAARVFALLQPAEIADVEGRLRAYVQAWPASRELRERFAEPAAGLEHVLQCFEGIERPEGCEGLRVRAYLQPLRLSTLVPEDRRGLIDAALRRLETGAAAAPAPATAARPGPPPGARGAAVVAEIPASPPASPTPEPPGGPLTILLACPKCAAPISLDDETVSVRCAHCGSLLIASAPERGEAYLDGDRIGSPEQALEVVIAYRLYAQRAEIVGRYARAAGDEPRQAPPEWLIERELRAFEERLRQQAQLIEAHRVHVPYWHLAGAIVQGSLGRFAVGGKQVRLRSFGVEHTAPGYDVGRANLRDRGLRLARSRVRPLTVERVRALGGFVPWRDVTEAAHAEVKRWRQQRLEPGFDPIVTHGELLFARQLLVYRAYWLAHVAAGRGPQWVLLDGSFRTIAGYPEPREAAELLGQAHGDPLGSGGASYRRVHVVASRCPDCGAEQPFDPRHHVSPCPSCHLALAPQPQGIRVLPCDHVASRGASAEYLPFWRFGFRLETDGLGVVSDLPGLAAALFPKRRPRGFAPRGAELWVPGVRLLGTENGDEVFRAACEWIHAAPPAIVPGKVPLGERGRLWGASLSRDQAAALARFVLLGLHSRPAAAALSLPLVQKAFARGRLSLGEGRLTLVPCSRAGEELCPEGSPVRIPLLLLEGGPRLEALKASVHQVMRAR